MPTIQLEARLLRITKSIAPGQWLMIFPDDRYEVIDHGEAMRLQGKHTRHAPPKVAKPPVAKQSPPIRPKHSIVVGGKTIFIEPQKLSLLQYMQKHGDMSVADLQTLGMASTALSALKSLGFVTSTKAENNTHIYSLTNEGRAIAAGVSVP